VNEVEAGGSAGEPAGESLRSAPLTDGEEILLRQVHPTFFDNGEPMNQAFRPSRADEGMLSVDRGSMTSAKESYDRHTETFGLKSVGVWGLLVGEVIAEDLETIPDAFPGNDAHCVVDFRGLTKNECRAKSMILRHRAVERGCLHKP
jgi:hypothetical protein